MRFQRGRFGHSTSFSDLFSADEEVVNDYIVGILVLGLILAVFFVCWGILLIVLKCFGPSKAGFLSGAPFQATSEEGAKVNPWIKRGRITFFVSINCFIVFAIILVTAGIGNMNSTTTVVGAGALFGYDYFSSTQYALTQVVVTLELLQEVQTELLEELRTFYDAVVYAGQVWQGSGSIRETVEVLIHGVEELQEFVSDPLKDLDSTLTDGQQNCESIYSVTEEIDLKALQWGLGLVLTIFPALLLGCLYWTAYGRHSGNRFGSWIDGCRTWFLWPVFVLLVVVSIVICCAFSIAGLVNSDFCSGGSDQSPDGTVLEILEMQEEDPTSMKYRAITYLVNQCEVTGSLAESPYQEVRDLEGRISTYLQNLESTIDETVSVGVDVLTNETGFNATNLLQDLREATPGMDDLFQLVLKFLDKAACEPLYKVYYTVAHRAACSDSYTGTFWIFMSMLLMSFFGLGAITFRSALYPVVDADLEKDLELQGKQDVVVSVDDNGEVETSRLQDQDSLRIAETYETYDMHDISDNDNDDEGMVLAGAASADISIDESQQTHFSDEPAANQARRVENTQPETLANDQDVQSQSALTEIPSHQETVYEDDVFHSDLSRECIDPLVKKYESMCESPQRSTEDEIEVTVADSVSK